MNLKKKNLLEQRKSPDQAISSTLYANAQIKQKVTSSIEKMKRLDRLKADSVWKIIDTLDEPLLTTAKILSTMPVTQVSIERLFSSIKFILSDHRRVVNRAGLFGKLRAYFGPDTMLTTKLSKNKIILLHYIYSMNTDLVLHSCRP